ncbi:MAG TPA: penicillin acylase family protein [Candidatus Dormibacteraeota bacterium]|nr:penicillin acylase family protein [Candidatus Dormibacteraeota bacterium]
MRRRFTWRRVLAGIAIVAVIVVVVTVVAGVTLLRRSYTAIDGEQRLIGLDEAAQVVRDTNGVPHIYAETAHDLFYLQGYVTASDRLWELEFLRRIGRARLSEIFGTATLDADKFVRTLGWYRVARREVGVLLPEVRAALDAYAAGVNKYVDTHRDSPPLEFVVLGINWEPWEPADSAVIGKIMAWDLSGNMDAEILHANVASRLGDGALATLFPALPRSTPPILAASGGALARAPGAAQLRAMLGDVEGAEIGSNNWVISGAHTVSGKPLLANDPHLGVRNPSIWYLAHLSGAGLDVAGYSIPGAPGIVIGHNARIAWGVTNLGPDTEDLYEERPDPKDPRRFEFGGAFEVANVFVEEIKVKDAPTVRLQVVETRHGPIVTPVFEGLTRTLALRWTALDPGHLLDALYRLDRAASWQEFREALALWDVPGQNFVYADVDGHIGYQATGKIPIRPGGASAGDAPQPGWDGAHEWQGYIPFAELPFAFDPADGMIVTANQRLVDAYPYKISNQFDPGFRAQRIHQLLAAADTLTADDMTRIQMDVTDVSAETFLAFLRTMPVESDRARQAQRILRSWDASLRAREAGGAIYESWLLHFCDRVFRDKLGDDLYGDFLGTAAFRSLYDMSRTPDHPWFVVLADPLHHGRDALAAMALEDALDELTRTLGPDMSTWQWGKLHQVTFGHPLGTVLPAVFNIGPFANSGGYFTVDNGAFDPREPYAQTTHPSMRMVVDLADLEAMRVVYPTGQSGQPFAGHWGDLTRKWLDGGYVTLRFATSRQPPLEGTLSFKAR